MNYKKLAILVLLGALIITAYLNRDLLQIETLQQWVENAGSFGWIAFVLIYIAATVLFLPASLLTLLGGFLFGPIVGHVGDGNFHTTLLVELGNAADLKEAQDLAHRMAERALRLGGTVTGEHGVGLGKRKYMEAEHGEGWALMGQIKRTLDPQNLLNPGKLVPGN